MRRRETSQFPRASEVMNLRKESTTCTLPDQSVSQSVSQSVGHKQSHVAGADIIAENDFEFLILLPVPSECSDDRHAPLCLFHMLLGVGPRPSRLIGKRLTN